MTVTGDSTGSLPAIVRVGYARDRHSFGPGGPLALGGIDIPGPRLVGHSDGDVALHAIAGALLGAGCLGDLGRLFPSDDRTPRGAPSAGLLLEVVERLAAAGYRPLGVDLTIEGARPRLDSRLDAMRDAIADLVALPRHAVSVKASSGNLGGDEGAGRSIAASAIATIGGTA
jgi:2-C-methyl-D-erythritol 2,4-cyclodiphosphate synthase